jgi:uncharacterized protein VirK/YbjX
LYKDARFFELSSSELRKNLDEVVSHKRNQYRKIFAMLDAVDSTIVESLEQYLLKNTFSQEIV